MPDLPFDQQQRANLTSLAWRRSWIPRRRHAIPRRPSPRGWTGSRSPRCTAGRWSSSGSASSSTSTRSSSPACSAACWPASSSSRRAWSRTIGFLGVPASGFLARGLAPIAPLGVEGWRWMFVIGALGSVVVAFLRRSLPESPRWLAANGRGEEADAVVRRFEADIPAAELPEPDPVHVAPRERGAFRELLVPPFRRRTGMMAVFHLLQSFGYYGFGTLVPLVLVAKGFPVVQSLLFSALTFLGYPIGSLL